MWTAACGIPLCRVDEPAPQPDAAQLDEELALRAGPAGRSAGAERADQDSRDQVQAARPDLLAAASRQRELRLWQQLWLAIAPEQAFNLNYEEDT